MRFLGMQNKKYHGVGDFCAVKRWEKDPHVKREGKKNNNAE